METQELTGNPLKLANRGRLAGFRVWHGTVPGGVTAVMGVKVAPRGLVSFRCVWAASGPEGAVVFAGWWPMPMGYTAILAELDRALSPGEV